MAKLSALIAMSAFKGRLSNLEACDIVGEALRHLDIAHTKLPMGDGGGGTLWTVKNALRGEIALLPASDPLGRKIEARVLCLPHASAPEAVYVESSETCGLALLKTEERDALRASSTGLGECLRVVYERWKPSLRRLFIGLGDTATSDGGMGMLSALGFSFQTHRGQNIWPNAIGLRQIQLYKAPPSLPFSGVKITVLCDVLNPLCGPNGSARIFASQKGASPGQVSQIEEGLEAFATLIQNEGGRNLRLLPMTGAAGGIAGSLLAFFQAELVLGSQFLMDWIGLGRLLESHSFLITGEGKTDAQTLAGKGPYELIERAERAGKKAILISGAIDEGIKPLLRSFALQGDFACGDTPNARDALFDKCTEVFSNRSLLDKLTESSSH